MRRLLPAVAALTLLAACGDDGAGAPAGSSDGAPKVTEASAPNATAGSTGTAGTTAADGTTAPAPVAEAPEALQFAAPLVGGGELDLRQYAGTTVALWFWAPT